MLIKISKILLFTFLFTGISCIHSKKIGTSNEMMLGSVSKKEFKQSPYIVWFEQEYNSYALDKNSLKQIKKKLKNKEIEVFFGSWCSDSRREVPRFIKILDYLDVDYKNVRFIALDHNKVAPTYKENIRNIVYVPTFIFLSNNKEIGRIIETPEETLELDMVKLLR